jgi:hypothetical protein
VAITQAQLLPFSATASAPGKTYGFHPSFYAHPNVCGGKLAVIANAGTRCLRR